jgi:thiol-disulfide isomerase/thioredoxin
MSGPEQKRRGRLLLVLEIALVIAITYSIFAWRSRDMLATGQEQPAPALDLPRLDGSPFDLAALAGRPVLVYFFAPWCRVCALSAPNLKHVARFGHDDLAIVTVALDWRDANDVRQFVAEAGLGHELVLGNAATAAQWRVPGYPSYYVLDRAHRIRFRDFGYSTTAGLLLRTWAAGAGGPAATSTARNAT